MKYPIWFPYPRCWLRTIILLFSFGLAVFLLRVIGRISITAIFAGLLLADDPEPLSWTLIAWLVILGVMLPIYLLAHIHQFLWSDPNPKLPKWMPNWASLGEGVWSWGVAITACIISMLMLVEFSPYNHALKEQIEIEFVNSDRSEIVEPDPLEIRPHYRFRVNDSPELTKTELNIVGISWLFTSAYLHHFRYLIARSINLKPRKRES